MIGVSALIALEALFFIVFVAVSLLG